MEEKSLTGLELFSPLKSQLATMKKEALDIKVENVLFIKTHPNFPTHILATMFDVCDSNIVSIRAGKTWKHVII